MIDLTIRAPCGNCRVLVSWNTAVFLLVRNAGAAVGKSGAALFYIFVSFRPVLFWQWDADNVALGSDAQLCPPRLSQAAFFPAADGDRVAHSFILLV